MPSNGHRGSHRAITDMKMCGWPITLSYFLPLALKVRGGTNKATDPQGKDTCVRFVLFFLISLYLYKYKYKLMYTIVVFTAVRGNQNKTVLNLIYINL